MSNIPQCYPGHLIPDIHHRHLMPLQGAHHPKIATRSSSPPPQSPHNAAIPQRGEAPDQGRPGNVLRKRRENAHPMPSTRQSGSATEPNVHRPNPVSFAVTNHQHTTPSAAGRESSPRRIFRVKCRRNFSAQSHGRHSDNAVEKRSSPCGRRTGLQVAHAIQPQKY